MRLAKSLGLSAVMLFIATTIAAADVMADLKSKLETYSGGRAFYYMLMTPFDDGDGDDYGDWGRGNERTLYKLIGGGYLNAYKVLSRDCQDGLNALRPVCLAEKPKTRYSFTEKALPFFGAARLGDINIPGLTNARIVIGKVKSYTIVSMTASGSEGCDVDVVARKELSEKNDVGNLILAGNVFEERLCFVKNEGGYKLKKFHPVY
jgi:hypothetical protein